MVQVAGLGLGAKNTQTSETQPTTNYFEFSSEVVVISLIAMFLAILSCAGYFIFHCCPLVLPAKLRNIRAHIYQGHDKHKKFLPRQQFSDEQELFSVNYSSNNSKPSFGNKRIPNIVISTASDQLTSDAEFTEIPLVEDGKHEDIT